VGFLSAGEFLGGAGTKIERGRIALIGSSRDELTRHIFHSTANSFVRNLDELEIAAED
jgi:hypothetical protein